MSRAEFIYIGVRKSDGSIRASCCDDPGKEADTAEKVSDWIKRGLTVERLTDAEYQSRVARSALEASNKGGE